MKPMTAVSPQPVPDRVAIITHPALAAAPADAERISASLRQAGLGCVLWGPYSDQKLRQRVASGGFDLLIALGGDGTMLRTGHLAAPLGIPVLGVNLGRFGFLMELQPEQWDERLPDLLAGRYWLEERMLLTAGHVRGEEWIGRWDVINDVVVTRGQYVRPIGLEVRVDGQLLARYVADGLIAATPTGSSAYALAAGGPILPPELRNILIVPVAPHLSLDRAVILSEGASVSIQPFSEHEVVFSVDGQAAVHLQPGDRVQVVHNPASVRFVRFQDRGYFYRNITKYMEQNPAAGDFNDSGNANH